LLLLLLLLLLLFHCMLNSSWPARFIRLKQVDVWLVCC
jgi:hypothetical protein